MTSAGDAPAARNSRTPVSPGRLRELRTVRSADERMVQVRGRGPAPEQPPQPDLRRRRVQQVAPADDQRDVLAQIVDDDAEPVRPVAVAVADGQVAGRCHLVRARAERVRSIHVSEPAPRATRQDRPVAARARGTARAADAPPRSVVRLGPGRERRARAVAAIDQPVGPQPLGRVAVGRQRVRVGLAHRAGIRREPQPGQILEDAPHRTPRAPASGRGPRCATGPRRRPPRPHPRPRPRWPRAPGAGSPSAPARSGSARRAAGRAGRSGQSSPPSRAPPSRAARSRSRVSRARVATNSRR